MFLELVFAFAAVRNGTPYGLEQSLAPFSWVVVRLRDKGLDDFAAELAELFESTGVKISQSVVIQTEQS